MTSPRRLEANRKNARASTGPKSPEGKARSALNALKHGMTARQVVLPGEDAAAFEQRLADWLDDFPPPDAARRFLVERAVHASWRLDRCARHETATLAENVRHAVERYDLERENRAEELGRRLIAEPIDRDFGSNLRDPAVRERLDLRAADDPPVLARQLRGSARGVAWLLDRWRELGEALGTSGYWTTGEKFRAVRLLGRRHEDILEDREVTRVFLACNVAHPEAWDFYDEVKQARLGVDGAALPFLRMEALRARRPADQAAAQADLRDVVDGEVSRLEALREVLEPRDQLDRDGAEARALFDDSPSGVLRRRYETACERELHKAVQEMSRFPLVANDDPGLTPQGDVFQNEPIPEVVELQDVAVPDPPEPAAPSAGPAAGPTAGSPGGQGPARPRKPTPVRARPAKARGCGAPQTPATPGTALRVKESAMTDDAGREGGPALRRGGRRIE